MSATSSKHIALSYNIIPPADVSSADVKIGPDPVPPSDHRVLPLLYASSTSAYYKSASSTLRELQRQLNESLTAWKDAIGDREKAKEDLGKVGYGKGRATRMTAGVDAQVPAVADGQAVQMIEEEEEEEVTQDT